MERYVMPLNIIVFVASFWTALIYGVATRDWLGALLIQTLGVSALTSDRLTPSRGPEPDDC